MVEAHFQEIIYFNYNTKTKPLNKDFRMMSRDLL